MNENRHRFDVQKIATLARLAVAESEAHGLQADLEKILTHIEKLEELDTAGVEPASHGVVLGTRLRRDEVWPGLSREDALAEAPGASQEFFVVPRFVEGA